MSPALAGRVFTTRATWEAQQISATTPVLLYGTFILSNKEWGIQWKMCRKLETIDKCESEP